MNLNEYKIVVIAGSSTLAKSYLKERLLFLKKKKLENIKITLIGRNLKKLENTKFELEQKGLVIEIFISNFKIIEDDYVSFIKEQNFDEIILAQGQLTNQDKFFKDKNYLIEDLNINLLSFIFTINIATDLIRKNNRGIIIVFGSIAGDLGKKSNYTYSYTKSAIENYLQGVKHRYPEMGIFLIKPGPTKTNMTINFSKDSFLWSEPKKIAKDINFSIKTKKFQTYSPWWWKYLLLVLKSLPKKIFYRLNI